MQARFHPDHPSVDNVPATPRWHRYVPMSITLCVGLALTIGLFTLIRYWEQRENQTNFEFASKHVVEAIRLATERVAMVHEIMRQDYYGSSDKISQREFSLMCEPFIAHVPSLKVLQWAPRVPAADRRQFEEAARRAGLADYEILRPGPKGTTAPAEPRKDYFPIRYAATRQNFPATYGWDFGEVPILHDSMVECRDKNSFVISPPLALEMIGPEHPMVQTFLPVYRDFENARTVAQRRTLLSGYLVGLCQIDELVECALKYASGPQGIDMALVDASLPGARQLLYFHASRMWAEEDKDAARAAATKHVNLDPQGIHFTAEVGFGSRKWLLICTPTPAFFTIYTNWRSWTLLGFGLLLTYMATRYIWTATTRRERIERIVAERTRELRQKDEQLRQSQKLEAVGALAGGIAHEFNNLLQAIGGYTRYAMEEMKPEDQSYQDLECVLQASDRAASLTRQLLSFSRRQTVDRKQLDANEMVSDLTRMLRPLLGEHIKLKMLLGKRVGAVFADAGSFQQVLVNLCLNARDAMPAGGEIIVKTERINVSAEFAEHYADLQPGPYVELSVTDTGHGMPPDVREHIFEPFYTTKPVGQGTGLGLPTVYGIVQQHEGAIHVYSEVDHGSTFKIYLPAIVAEGNGDAGDAGEQLPRGAETLLVAEDDPLVQNIARRILQKGGYTVLTASDGEEALRVLQQHQQEISLVLLDAVMPKLSGRDVYRRMKEEFPQMRVLFCSGYDPETSQSNYILSEQLRLVEKPYDPDILLRTVREVLDAEELCQVD